MTFQQAVHSTLDITTGYRPGLQALGGYSTKIRVSDTRLLGGSVDIDACTVDKYPNANRWDYAFDYKGEAFFVEVHSAYTGEVDTVIAKLNWLKSWLRDRAPSLEEKKAKSRTPYYWLQSDKFEIPKTSRHFRLIVQEGLKPLSILIL